MKRPNQFQRIMMAMEKAGAVRKDGKSTATELGYALGGKEDPHFQDHGGNVIPDRVEANEDFCDMHQELSDDGRSDGYGESYGERNT